MEADPEEISEACSGGVVDWYYQGYRNEKNSAREDCRNHSEI